MGLRRLFNLLRLIFLALGALLIGLGLQASLLWLRLVLLLPGFLLAVLGLVFVWWYLRPNTSRINPDLQIETWDVVSDELHHSNTDLIHHGGFFYLVHASSPYHFFSTDCRLVLRRSVDAREWVTLAQIGSPGEDIRDPKLAYIGGKLFLYALVNRSFDPEPYTTVFTSSTDGGLSWAPLERLKPEGWLLWKPKTLDGERWYAAAYWHEHGKSALFSTTDGTLWERVGPIYEQGRRNDETDIEFLPDGSMLSTARLEGDFKEGGYSMFFGHPNGATLVSTAEPPYTHFETRTISLLTRLDGPALFPYQGRVFAIGRYQPGLGEPFTRQGSIFARKRTSLWEIKTEGLVWLTDVPSAGDTAYAGVALHDSCLYFSYYTSPVERDYPWIVGMLNPTPIRMAKLELRRLVDSASG